MQDWPDEDWPEEDWDQAWPEQDEFQWPSEGDAGAKPRGRCRAALASLGAGMGALFARLSVTWPVGADLLFERVRSQRYLAVTCVLNLYEWFTDFLVMPRSEIGSRRWTAYQLQILFYRDCAGRHGPKDLSDWSGLECTGRPYGGPWWELLMWIFPLLLVNSALNFVNNPFRSRWWGVVALVQIGFGAARYVVLLRAELAAQGAVAEMDLFALYRRALDLAGMFGPLLSWLAVLALLVHLVFTSSPFMEKWHESALKHTRHLLLRPASGCAPASTPARFQQLAESLRGTCCTEDLAACALAALHEEQRRQGDRAKTTLRVVAPPPSWRCWRRRGKHTKQQCHPEARHLPGASGDAAIKKGAQQHSPGRPCRGSGHSDTGDNSAAAEKIQHRLPGLVYVASLLSFLVMLLFSHFVLMGTVQLQAICAEYTAAARNASDFGVQMIEASAEALEGLREAVARARDKEDQLQHAGELLLKLHGALVPLPPRLQSEDQETAEMVERAIQLLRTTVESLPADAMARGGEHANRLKPEASDLELVEGLLQWREMYAAPAQQLHEWVHGTSDIIMEAAWLSCVAAVVAGFLGMTGIVVMVAWTCHAWQRARHEFAVGAQKQSKRWQPKDFHPVRAPMLPGIMASSALFGFLWLFSVAFVVIQAVWWSARMDIDWQAFKKAMINAALLLVVRVVVFDGILGRRVLSHNGFVIRWAGFSWYICFAMPFHLITGLAMAFSRFVVLVCLAAVSVMRVDTTLLPPQLQRFDPGYVSFMASVLMAHRHQNPVWQTFMQVFMSQGDQAQAEDEHYWTDTLASHKGCLRRSNTMDNEVARRRTQARVHWSLLRTLFNNPQLASERRCYDWSHHERGHEAEGHPAEGLSTEDIKVSLSGEDGFESKVEDVQLVLPSGDGLKSEAEEEPDGHPPELVRPTLPSDDEGAAKMLPEATRGPVVLGPAAAASAMPEPCGSPPELARPPPEFDGEQEPCDLPPELARPRQVTPSAESLPEATPVLREAPVHGPVAPTGHVVDERCCWAWPPFPGL